MQEGRQGQAGADHGAHGDIKERDCENSRYDQALLQRFQFVFCIVLVAYDIEAGLFDNGLNVGVAYALVVKFHRCNLGCDIDGGGAYGVVAQQRLLQADGAGGAVHAAYFQSQRCHGSHTPFLSILYTIFVVYSRSKRTGFPQLAMAQESRTHNTGRHVQPHAAPL